MTARDSTLASPVSVSVDGQNIENVISVRDITFSYDGVAAVDGLSLDVGRGEVFGFLGHNGAGKTTTIRLLNGLLQPSKGQIRVLGNDPLSEGPAVRARTGVLTGTPSLDDRLTGEENLNIYGQLYGVPASKLAERVSEMLALFDLADRGTAKVGTYSKGMKQRLALARALLHDPDLLFLDEPTDGLDPVATRHVHQLIMQLSSARKHTIFLCTHNLVEAQQLCGRVAVLEHGKLLAMGTPAELAHHLGQHLTLEIQVGRAQIGAARASLQKRKLDVQADEQNETLKILGADQEAIPDLVAGLVGDGIRIYKVVPQEPTLEDVYFALHGEQEGVQ